MPRDCDEANRTETVSRRAKRLRFFLRSGRRAAAAGARRWLRSPVLASAGRSLPGRRCAVARATIVIGPLLGFALGVAWSRAPRSEAAAQDAAPRELASQILRRADVKADAQPFGVLRKYFDGAQTRGLSDVVTGIAVLEPGQQVHP